MILHVIQYSSVHRRYARIANLKETKWVSRKMKTTINVKSYSSLNYTSFHLEQFRVRRCVDPSPRQIYRRQGRHPNIVIDFMQLISKRVFLQVQNCEFLFQYMQKTILEWSFKCTISSLNILKWSVKRAVREYSFNILYTSRNTRKSSTAKIFEELLLSRDILLSLCSTVCTHVQCHGWSLLLVRYAKGSRTLRSSRFLFSITIPNCQWFSLPD
jgi:hypothetical protein